MATSQPFRNLYSTVRREPRVAVDRQVQLSCVGDRKIMAATMLDWSINGFRVKHRLPLRSGDNVLVITKTATLTTRVVWTRKTERECEAGLSLVTGENAIRSENLPPQAVAKAMANTHGALEHAETLIQHAFAIRERLTSIMKAWRPGRRQKSQ